MRVFLAFLIVFTALTSSALAQSRDQTREQLRQLLATAGQRSDVNVDFHQSTKQPYNFAGDMTTGLKYADELEIVISVTKSETIDFRVYPHYKGKYINIDRARDKVGLMRKMLFYSYDNFFYWGADDDNDCFAGYTITLESGFPSDAIVIVLRSIKNQDQFVGELAKYI